MERVDGAQARLKHSHRLSRLLFQLGVERVDGAQARLKPKGPQVVSGLPGVERVDGAQARLKQCTSTVSASSREVERVDGAQARLKHTVISFEVHSLPSGKGGWGSGEIETVALFESSLFQTAWKGWMGLRRD